MHFTRTPLFQRANTPLIYTGIQTVRACSTFFPQEKFAETAPNQVDKCLE
jgi:hypothetical protein